ncbi:TPA: hypothetical protein K8N36_000950 [Clostridium perfringens]|uniref:Uncharacterized protein n=1 Tax=Clostridium perfringens TaxID=1502 RepID=A0A2X3E7W6_CLOPF|nr:hypothetical protein [Clostridium perfringens]UWG09988.1 MAG: hypothetical protein [Bacteriophage sp.]EJT6501410.1 hypothetical protein [Clostridium perfringens]MDK0680544.1 hypothetical protein [Clostridium perfringens]MDM0592825.1 hypothetical protein [Clostridium perfringens]MDM0595824.1 hypothetical protein [Clostridium perfringens]
MAVKVTIVEPDITEEENEKNWQMVLKALEPIAQEIFERKRLKKEKA